MDKATNSKKPWYKKWWVWVIVVIVIIGIGGASSGNKTDITTKEDTAKTAPAAEQPKAEEPAKWDVEANYAKINNGMSKAEVEAAVGKKSDSCTESTTEYIGKTEICSYGGFGDKGMISVTYSNDTVSGKTKTNF